MAVSTGAGATLPARDSSPWPVSFGSYPTSFLDQVLGKSSFLLALSAFEDGVCLGLEGNLGRCLCVCQSVNKYLYVVCYVPGQWQALSYNSFSINICAPLRIETL